MESRPAIYTRSICQPVASHNCISQVIYWPHARDSCGTEQVNGYMKGSPGELCTGEPQNTTVCKVRSCGTVQIGKMYSILQVGLKYCLQVELGLSVEQEWGWLAIQWKQSMSWHLPVGLQMISLGQCVLLSVSNVPTMKYRGLVVLSLGICIILQHFLHHGCVCVGWCVLLLRCIKAWLNNFAWNGKIMVMLL